MEPSDAPSERDLLRWSEALAAIARTGLAFSDVVYERERFEVGNYKCSCRNG